MSPKRLAKQIHQLKLKTKPPVINKHIKRENKRLYLQRRRENAQHQLNELSTNYQNHNHSTNFPCIQPTTETISKRANNIGYKPILEQFNYYKQIASNKQDDFQTFLYNELQKFLYRSDEVLCSDGVIRSERNAEIFRLGK